MFLTRREPGVPLSLFRSYPLPFSPPFLLYCSLPFLFFYVFLIDIYICCSLILFPFLLLFFFIIPYPSFSSISFSLIYICCSFRGVILFVVFPTVAACFWPTGNLEYPCLFSDLILFPFLLLFFYSVPYPSFFFLCLFHWSISAVVSGEAFYLLFSAL